jgi:ribosomal protein S18 acetylase RimI-like enzyme
VNPDPGFVVEALSTNHDRASFCCGAEQLDNYFHRQARQDIRKRATACFVAVDLESGKVAGFYTLAASAVALSDLPETLAKRLPRYPSVPVARMGRLAIDQAYQGRRLGAAMLWDAASRVAKSEVMAFALIVDAKDETAQAFYLHHGFVNFGSLPLCLILPLASIPALAPS